MDPFIIYGLVLYAAFYVSSTGASVYFEEDKVISAVLCSLLCMASTITLALILVHSGLGADEFGRLIITLIMMFSGVSQIFLAKFALERYGLMARLKKEYKNEMKFDIQF